MINKHNSRIYLSPPHMGGTEIKYIKKAIRQNWVAPLGPNVDEFEHSLEKYLGIQNAIALCSGTSAIHLALIILGVEPNDEVIASTFTFSATINPIVYQGALPVLVDSERETWNMSPELLEIAIKDRISKGKKVKAIIPVHLFGMPANMKAIMKISESYGIPVIEDAAEALGSRYDGKPVGSFGSMAILSFNGNKIITTSGGGALITHDSEIAVKVRHLATQARDKAPYYQHSHIGYNYRMSNILAGIGCGQMEVFEDRLKQRRDNFRFYKENLGHHEGIRFLEEPDKKFFSNYWLTAVRIDPILTGKTNNDILNELGNENIETRPLWKPMHRQPVFSNCPAYVNGVSDDLFANGLCLPSGSNLSDNDRERILNSLLKSLDKS